MMVWYSYGNNEDSSAPALRTGQYLGGKLNHLPLRRGGNKLSLLVTWIIGTLCGVPTLLSAEFSIISYRRKSC